MSSSDPLKISCNLVNELEIICYTVDAEQGYLTDENGEYVTDENGEPIKIF